MGHSILAEPLWPESPGLRRDQGVPLGTPTGPGKAHFGEIVLVLGLHQAGVLYNWRVFGESGVVCFYADVNGLFPQPCPL